MDASSTIPQHFHSVPLSEILPTLLHLLIAAIMSQSVASSEPSSVGLPSGTAWSLAGDWSLASNSFHYHRDGMASATTGVTSMYPTEFVAAAAAAAAAAMPFHDDDQTVTECPLCGNQERIMLSSNTTKTTTNHNHRAYKTTGLDDEYRNTPTHTTSLSDFELASMLPTAKITNNHNLSGEAAAAAAMGACWVCIAAIADANSHSNNNNNDNNNNDTTVQNVSRQQQQYQSAGLSSSFSTLESFQDEHSVSAAAVFAAATVSPRATISVNDFGRHDYRRYCQLQSQIGHLEPLESETAPTCTVVYIGEYNDRGQRHGPHGELIWDNGDRYVGSFVCGKRTGTGTMFHRDGM
jgi:hypothetical protein